MIQNITIRVPWSDNGWCGKVCNHELEKNVGKIKPNTYSQGKGNLQAIVSWNRLIGT